mmetsp:Transcript_128677/g.222299  ORF Transcript_128677/g.222299 Transcript_128677/m.222299 type:complete len:260 (+) Transcript_128677:311-1090(+)
MGERLVSPCTPLALGLPAACSVPATEFDAISDPSARPVQARSCHCASAKRRKSSCRRKLTNWACTWASALVYALRCCTRASPSASSIAAADRRNCTSACLLICAPTRLLVLRRSSCSEACRCRKVYVISFRREFSITSLWNSSSFDRSSTSICCSCCETTRRSRSSTSACRSRSSSACRRARSCSCSRRCCSRAGISSRSVRAHCSNSDLVLVSKSSTHTRSVASSRCNLDREAWNSRCGSRTRSWKRVICCCSTSCCA